MKILITSDLYFPMTNGVAVFAHNLALGLAKKGHEVAVICPSFNGKKHHEKKDGVTVYYAKSMRLPFYPDQINEVPDKKKVMGVSLPRLVYKNGIWVSPYPFSYIKKIVKSFKPDVIHNQTAETIAIGALMCAKRYNIPLVSTGHAYPDNLTGQAKLLKPIKRPLDAVLRSYMASFLKNSEYATMPTELAIGDLVPKNRKHFKVTVEALSNGVDLSCFKPGKLEPEIAKKYHLPVGKPTVLYVGRVDPEKSIGNVVKAFAKVLEKVPDAKMVVAGDGTDKANLIKLSKDLHIKDSILFLGKVMLPDLAEVYRCGDLFATASKTETQGIVLIEAAASGLPLVAVDAGAIREVCQNNKNGFLCKPDDIDGLARSMTKILSDKKLQKEFSKNSIEISKQHDLNHTLQRFEEIYLKAIDLKNHE